MRAQAAQLSADVRLLARLLLFGVGALVLLAAGLAGIVTTVVVGGFLAYLLSIAGVAAVVVMLAALLVRPYSAPVRTWLARRPLRSAVPRVAARVGRALATVAVRWLLACRASARKARARTAARSGTDIPMAYRPLPDGPALRLRTLATDPATWRDLGYLVAAPAYVALACLVLFLGLVSIVAVLTAAPEVRLTATVARSPWWSDPGPWLMFGAGLTLVVLALSVVHLLARGATALGVALLSAGEGARVRAELEEQRLRRQLAVDAAERERRRIERDLHDGAQQRLVALGMSLGLAREMLPHDPVAGAALVAEAHSEAKLALAELRDLARGIHPAILGDRGLDAALSALLRRTPTPVSVMVTLPQRPPVNVESAAYFVVAEALTNVTRHAAATRATVSISAAAGTLHVEVADDGVGGAEPAAGTGLAGLAERVAALGGRLAVDSPPGGPTTIRAEIPCAS